MRKILGHMKKAQWPELSPATLENAAQPWEMHVNLPVVDGERVLLLTCLANPNYESLTWRGDEKPADFRLLISKKHGDYRIISREGKAAAGSARIWGGRAPDTSYFETGLCAGDEARIRRFLGRDAGTYTRNRQLGNLWWYAVKLREAKQTERKQSRGEVMAEEVYHCPEELPEGFVAYIQKEIVEKDDTIIYKKGGKRGLCYRCGERVQLERGAKRFRNYEYTECPNCGALCQAILEDGAAWRADNVCETAAFQKGDDGTLFIRIFRLQRSREAKYRDLRGYLWEFERYAIRGKYARRWTRERRQGCWGGMYAAEHIWLDHWEVNNQGYTVIDTVFSGNMPGVLAGTSLQYVCMQDYIEKKRYNPPRYAICAARYPVLEFLYKRGYTELVHQRVCSVQRQYAGTLCWSGETLKDCFKFPVRWMKVLPAGEWTMAMIERCNQLYERNPAAGNGEVLISAKYNTNPLQEYTQYAGIEKMVAYVIEQNKETERPKRKWGETDAVSTEIRTYRDYLSECVKLGLDMTDKNVLFPPSLERAHERTMEQVEYEENRTEREAFKGQVEKLSKLSWSDKKRRLSIRPAASHAELKKEGAALHHCVAGYAPKMARGTTAIFLIRREEAPDEPYYTLELQNRHVVQCRTRNNKSYTNDPEIEAFVNEWMETKVKKAAKSQKEPKPETAA